MSGFLLFLQIVWLAGILINIYALVTIGRFSEADYLQVGLNRGSQRGIHILGIFLPGVGAVTGYYWLMVTKPKLDSRRRPSPTSGFPPPIAERVAPAPEPVVVSHSGAGTSSTSVSSAHLSEIPNLDSASTGPGALEYTVTFERRENLKFKQVGTASHEQLMAALNASTETFCVTPETLTGLALARLLKQGGDISRFHGTELCEYFLMGTAVGKVVFVGRPDVVDVMGLDDTSEFEDYLVAAREDAEFFKELSDAVLLELLTSLPLSVSKVLDESLEAEEEPSRSETSALTKMFVSGIAYVGFQSPQPSADPTW